MMKQKKLLSVVLALLLFFSLCTQSVFAAQEMDIQNLPSKGLYVKEMVSDTLIYENNAAQRYYPASITKLVTALTALDYLKLDEKITVGSEVYDVIAGSSLAHLVPGETLTFKDLLHGMMLPSGNDAANAIAAAVAKKTNPQLKDFAAQKAYFCSLMNNKAKSLGAKDSNFVNPSGLHDTNHYTTPYDMYLVGAACLNSPQIMKVVSQDTYTVANHTWYSTNLLLQRTYDNLKWIKKEGPNPFYSPYAKGLKTGHTIEAGRTIVAYYERDGMKVLSVVLQCSNDELFADANATLNYTTARYEGVSFGKEGSVLAQLPIENTKQPNKILEVVPEQDATVVVNKGDGAGITHHVAYSDDIFYQLLGKRFIKQDITKGDVVGKITLYNASGAEIKSVDLLALDDIVHDKYLFLRIALIVAILVLVLLTLLRHGRKRIRRKNHERKNIQRSRI